MKFLKAVALLAGVALVSACSGGGGSSPVINNPSGTQNTGTNPTQTAMIQIRFTIPGGAGPSSTKRRPDYISPSITSAILSAYQTSNNADERGGNNTTGTVSVYADLSSGSSSCTTNGNGSRTCSIFLPAPATPSCVVTTGVGCDFFEMDAYAGGAQSSGGVAPTVHCGGGDSRRARA